MLKYIYAFARPSLALGQLYKTSDFIESKLRLFSSNSLLSIIKIGGVKVKDNIRRYASWGVVIILITTGIVWYAAVQRQNHRADLVEQTARDERRSQVVVTSTTSVPESEPTTTTTTTSPVDTTVSRAESTLPEREPTTTTSSTTTTTLPAPSDWSDIEVNGKPFAEVRIDRLSSHWLGNTGYKTETLVRGDETELPDQLETALEGGLAWQGSSYSNWYDNGDNVVEPDEIVPVKDLGLPGEGKTVFIAGHRGGIEQNKAFGHLDEMQIGDEVAITAVWGVEYTYRVTETSATVHKTVLHEQASRLDELEGENILLYACEPGTSDRLFVVGELVSALQL